MADTREALDKAMSKLMQDINEAAARRIAAESHMGDPDNFTWAKARRDADAEAANQLARTISACAAHQRSMAQTPPQG